MGIPKIKNRQYIIVRIWLILSVAGAVILFLPFIEGYFLSDAFALVILGIFIFITGIIVSRIFLLRARKMERLLSGEKLLAQFGFDGDMRKSFAETMYYDRKAKAVALMWIVGVFFFVIIGGVMLLAMDGDDRLGFY